MWPAEIIMQLMRPAVLCRFPTPELDDKLNFLRHIKTLEAKPSRNVGILFKLKTILPTSALVTLYFALMH